jgi:hypothetical protein
VSPRTRVRTRPAAAPGQPADLHVQTEDNPWSAYINDHPQRKESSTFRSAKKAAHAILETLKGDDLPYGPGPWEMHHGGSLWVLANKRWRVYLAKAGVEWSMQFCADPKKIELLRRDAEELVAAFPDTLPALQDLGYSKAEEILNTPITDADGVAQWTDSLFNACVPLGSGDHSGVLPKAAGEHHYPLPVKSADFFRFDDFQLWVTLHDGTHAAVAPVGRRGSGDGRVRLMYARHGTTASTALIRAQRDHKAVILPDDSDEARQAFLRQRPVIRLPSDGPAAAGNA